MRLIVCATYGGLRLALPEGNAWTLKQDQPAYIVAPDDTATKTSVYVALKWGHYEKVAEHTITVPDA